MDAVREELIKYLLSGKQITLPAEVVENLARSLLEIVFTHYKAIWKYEKHEKITTSELAEVLGYQLLSDAKKWTLIFRTVNRGQDAIEVSLILSKGVSRVAFIRFDLEEQKGEKSFVRYVEARLYVDYGKPLNELGKQLQNLYMWLENFRKALKNHAPLGTFSKIKCKELGVTEFPNIVTVLLGSLTTKERWKGVGKLATWNVAEVRLWRYLYNSDKAVIERRVTEEPAGEVIERECWSIDLKILWLPV